ncbi:hypothetical protein L6472_05930 [Prevotella sp. E13-17]|uniref:hypothetical protein n=1 Tax=Prevotella sp. E13-17 TaxID=2913616 RepID=UPI001EDAFC54|nr:hypothetical protein [Prevotella sp. E13-17]UKK52116.1 hypothetical protein L6472_05930 [Prevotella sp. E13-17]
MKPKLINLQVMEAKNVICVWREDGNNENQDFGCGIACDTAVGNYMIPSLIAIGVFEDGTTKAGGLHGFNTINEDDGYDGMFLYNQFCYQVNLDVAKAFVRGLICCGEYKDEESAKAGVIKDMKLAGVKITDDAMVYLAGNLNHVRIKFI